MACGKVRWDGIVAGNFKKRWDGIVRVNFKEGWDAMGL